MNISKDFDSSKNMPNAPGLLKLITQGEEDVRDGRVKSQEEVFAKIAYSLIHPLLTSLF